MLTSTTTQKLIDAHKGPIAEYLNLLKRELDAFSAELTQSSTLRDQVPVRPVVVFESIEQTSASAEPTISGFRALSTQDSRKAAARAYSQLEYGIDDRVNRSPICHGGIGVPNRLIDQAKAINRIKDELKEAVAPIAGRKVRLSGKDADGNRSQLVRQLTTVLLRQIQHSSVNLLAAYRELPILDEPIAELQFMLTQTRSVPRKSVAELRAILSKRSDSLSRRDLDRLLDLDDTEYLVSPKAYYPRMRAHAWFQRFNDGKRVHRIVSAELPLLFPMTALSIRPKISEPKLKRADRKHPPARIEDQPTIKTLNFYRMKPEYREIE